MPGNREIFFNNIGLPSAHPPAIEIERAEGIFLFDAKGKKYFDLVSGVSVSSLGHSNPRVKEAVKKQIDAYMHLMVYGKFIQKPQVNLAEKLSRHLPDSLSCTYFVNSGSEAIEGALKLAKRYTGRTGIISFKNAYHGGTHGALSVLGGEKMRQAFRPLLPDTRQLDFNDFSQLEHISNKTACVLVEPIQAEAGIILPESGFLAAIRKKCDETGSLLIYDEIQMGMGRTGKLFCFEHFGAIPDILCLAKAFGGGMPLGAFIASKEIMHSLTNNPELGHITTFGGHPVSCAASLAAFEELVNKMLFKKADEKGSLFEKLLKEHPEIKNIRRKGLMMGLDLENTEKAAKLTAMFLEHGIIVDQFLFRPEAFRIAPPLIISDHETREAADTILACLDKL